MNRNAFREVLVCSVFALCMPICICRAADPSPDDVLKNSGLSKQGVVYELDADANLAVALRSWAAAKAKYTDANTRRTNLENNVRSAKATLQKLDQQNEIETNKLENITKNAPASYNHQVGVVNAIRSNIRDGIKVVESRQKLLEGLEDPTDEYTAAIQKLSQSMEFTSHKYETLAADPAVTDAIAAINRTAKPQVKLGPSDLFRTGLPKIRNIQKMVVSSTINFAILGGTPHVLVLLNGVVKAPMAIDSGAAIVMLSSETASQLTIKSSPTDHMDKFSIADGTIVEAKVVTLSSVQLGAFTVENVEAAILPPGVKGADNLLGGTFLKHFVYKMDLAGSSIHMTQIPSANAPANRTVGAVRKSGS